MKKIYTIAMDVIESIAETHKRDEYHIRSVYAKPGSEDDKGHTAIVTFEGEPFGVDDFTKIGYAVYGSPGGHVCGDELPKIVALAIAKLLTIFRSR